MYQSAPIGTYLPPKICRLGILNLKYMLTFKKVINLKNDNNK